MLDALKLKGQSVLSHGRGLCDRLGRGQARRHAIMALPLTAVLVIAGCSWFEDNSTPAPDTNPPQSSADQGKATPPAPGEGEAMGSATSDGTPGGTQTADAGKATFPDINSVPNAAPKPSIVNLDQAPSGLGADTANAQHTDDTLTMPNETAERPEKPTDEGQVASVEPTAPETPPTPPVVTPEAATPAPEATPPAPEAAQAPAPEAPAPAPEATMPAPETAPIPPAGEVATAGTPQAGSAPFEPNGPLYLTPGSLDRNAQVAEAPVAPAAAPAPAPVASAAVTPMPVAPTPITAPSVAAAPMPMPAAAPSGEAVSVDYSALDGLQGGGTSTFQSAPAMVPTMTATNAQIAGVGQAVGYVYFGNGSSQLSPADRQVLQQVVQLQRIQGGVLRIVGHASQRTGNLDALAQGQVNKRVSLERASMVAQALVGMGVQPMLVQVAAAGDGETLYSESTPAGEAGNRRAEVYLSQN
jgi:outer membrane protein OmpA-like peptidoglycan-associated protein